jgi:hypothetical protein
MKNIFFTSLTIFIFSAVIFAQSKNINAIQSQIKSLNAGKNISLEYDKSSNTARLMLLSDGFGGEQNKKNGLLSFTFGMKYDFSGTEIINPPEVFILTFWAKGKNTHFAESHTWKAKIDGETIEISEGRFAKKNGDDREFLNFVISHENLEKIANGKNVSFQIGNAEFKVSAEMLQNFANFLKISNPNQ